MDILEVPLPERGGTERDPVAFRLDGTVIRCRPELSQWALIELAGSGSEATGTDDEQRALGAFWQFLREIVDPADWPRFVEVCRRNRLGVDELNQVLEPVMQAMMSPPSEPSEDEPGTGGPASGSPGSSSSTTPFSKVVSLSEGTVRSTA